MLDHNLSEFQVAELAGFISSGDYLQYKGYTHKPVDIETFLFDPYFMNTPTNERWPEVLSALKEINSGAYDQAILTGGIGVAKSTIALDTQAYQLYLLSCYRNPHSAFGLAATDEIIIVFQNINATLARMVDYDRFRARMERSHYFTNIFPFDRSIESELRFPSRIIVKPVSGEATATIGQNVIGGMIDEVNYMQIVGKSKQAKDGGEYDQAHTLYRSIVTRRKTRFLSSGRLPGILCVVSSRKYPGQFTDLLETEVKEELSRTGTTKTYIYDKRIWDLVGERYSKEKFGVFIGDESRKPRILEKGARLLESDPELVIHIPVDFREDFERDLMEALRELAGVATLARFPFIMEAERVSLAMGYGHRSLLSRQDVDFVDTHLKVLPKRLVNPKALRFAHIDLGITGDAAGVAVGHIESFVNVNRGDSFETAPRIIIDLALRVIPPKGGEIQFQKIRELLYVLRDRAKVPIQWVTLDSFQSVDSRQILRSRGFKTGTVSVDTDPLPYDMVKSALYDRRLILPDDPWLKLELVSLEKDPKTGKVDHLSHGTKDIADALAGVVFGLTMRRQLWAQHGVLGRIPDRVSEAKQQAKSLGTDSRV